MTQRNRFYPALVAALASIAPMAGAADVAPAPVDAMAVYNKGAAVIQDQRTVDLTRGSQQIDWPLSGLLRPDTLWLQGNGVRLTGLNARDPDQGNHSNNVLAGRVGQPVSLIRDDNNGKTKRREATLVGLEGDSVFVRLNDRIERLTGDSPWRLSWPAGDSAKPGGLQLDIDADHAGRQKLIATYQIDGPSWQASYTGRYDAKAGKLSLQSMAVIDNSGGARLTARKAWLVAGDVSRASNGGPRPMMMAAASAKPRMAAQDTPQPAGDVYRYALEGGLNLAADAVRAVSIMPPVSVGAKRSYRFDNSWYANSRDERSHAEVRLTFKNSADVPLPAGVVRVYDGQHTASLMGEARIDDTPKDAPVELTLGQSFDITADRHVISDKKAAEDKRQRTLKLTVHNASKQQARVNVIEHLPDAAKIVSASTDRESERKDANTAQWQLDVPDGGQAELRYMVVWPERNR